MKLAVQLYTVRDQLSKDPLGTLKALKKMGYRYVETAGFAGKTAPEFHELLKQTGLRACAMHVGIDACEGNLEAILREADTIKAEYVVVPYVPESAYKNGWDRLGIRLQKIGEKVARAGKKFAYHNHAFEFQSVDGSTGWDIMTESSCPDHMLLEIDLYWAKFGKQDVAKLLSKHGSRTHLVHLKDGKFGGDPHFEEAGKGAMDWDELLPACKAAGVKFGMVELDTCPRDPLVSVKACLEFFHSKGIK